MDSGSDFGVVRSLGRFFLSTTTTFPMPVQVQPAQFIGPALPLPALDATLAIRIIHAFGNASDAGHTGNISLTRAAIALVAVGPSALVRVRIYGALPPPQTAAALATEGLWFGGNDPEMLFGNDYRELASAGIPTTMGSFQVRLETEGINGAAAVQTLTVSLGVLFELFQRKLSTV